MFSDPFVKAVLAGLFFSIWPILMNRSGLSGNWSSVSFTFFCLLGIIPFALMEGIPTVKANLVIVVVAGFVGSLGILQFNGMLSIVSPKEMGILFLTMVLVQITCAAIYRMVMAGGLEPIKLVGIAAALVAAYCLK